jgi:hypothetical protein
MGLEIALARCLAPCRETGVLAINRGEKWQQSRAHAVLVRELSRPRCLASCKQAQAAL